MGRAVIATYVAGIPELVEPGKTGWLVPAGDSESLARAMNESAAASPEQLHAMGRAGQARTREGHAIATEAAKLSALYFGAAA